MLDYAKQRNRGFGFVTYADPSVADRVVNSRWHEINNKTVSDGIRLTDYNIITSGRMQKSFSLVSKYKTNYSNL